MAKFIPFILILGLMLAILDLYVVYHWNKFAKSKSMNKLFRTIPMVLVLSFFILNIGISYIRFLSPSPNTIIMVLYAITTFWYLPKIVIVPFLLIKDLISFVKAIINKIRSKKTNPEIENLSSRREFVQTTGWALAAIPFASIGYNILKSPYNIKTIREDIFLYNLPEHLGDFKIVQISDLHAGSYISPNAFRQIVFNINLLDPDIVVLTGDFVNFHRDELKIIREDLYKIHAKFGIYACLGNHDHYMTDDLLKQMVDEFENNGIRVLINENQIVNTGKGVIQIAGVDNQGMNQKFADFDKALAGLNENEPIILLCHDPTNWDSEIVGKRKVDLMLSGHTHGGQFGFNAFNKEYSFASMVYKQWAGLYTEKDQFLYINRGVGMTGPPLRIGIYPEITVLTLKRELNLA